jgi:hypothetical protein
MASTNIQQILREHGGSMKRSQLITYLRGFSITLINRKLEELAMEGSIKISGNTIILVPTYEAVQMLKPGIVNEDKSIRRTGHKQVSIQYDQTLFRVLGRSGKLLKKVAVDEGMANLLVAIWKHGIPTTRSCQGGNGETAWIRFVSLVDVACFEKLVSPPLSIETWKLAKEIIDGKEAIELSFPPEDIGKITEELNKITSSR